MAGDRGGEWRRLLSRRLTAGRPDVIILDLMMPKMDGFEFLDKLRLRPAGQDIPVVIITAKDLTQEDRDRLNGGVERIIQKAIAMKCCGNSVARSANASNGRP